MARGRIFTSLDFVQASISVCVSFLLRFLCFPQLAQSENSLSNMSGYNVRGEYQNKNICIQFIRSRVEINDLFPCHPTPKRRGRLHAQVAGIKLMLKMQNAKPTESGISQKPPPNIYHGIHTRVYGTTVKKS